MRKDIKRLGHCRLRSSPCAARKFYDPLAVFVTHGFIGGDPGCDITKCVGYSRSYPRHRGNWVGLWQTIKQPLHRGNQNGQLFGSCNRIVLGLPESCADRGTAFQTRLGRVVEPPSEAGKVLQFFDMQVTSHVP